MNKIFLVLLVLALGSLAWAAASPQYGVLVDSNTDFALRLYQELRAYPGNIFFSPYSISTALAMTYGGARGNTASQMAATLHFDADQAKVHPAFAALQARLNSVQARGNVQLDIANSLWPQQHYPFLADYIALIKKHYGVGITPLDYQRATEKARQTINQWVENKTRNKIKNLIQPGILTTLTRLVLANAIYFKGKWAEPFDKRFTQEEDFFLLSGARVKVPLMAQKHEFAFGQFPSVQVLKLPYTGDDLSMIIILPVKVNGLAELERHLTVEYLGQWTSGLKAQEVEVFLPRFQVTSQFSLSKNLSRMGMPDAFDAQKADFSGMDGRPHWLYIGAVLHKAFVDVNEEGTEAAAATAVVMVGKMAKPVPMFRADHPFLFLIYENRTGSILFMGRILDPTKLGE